MPRSFFNKVLLIWALFCTQVQAQDTLAEEGYSARAIVTAGFTSGGDTLVDVEFEGGDDDQIKAGGAFLLGFGVEFLAADRRSAVQLSANYHFDSIDAENGEASFERYPLEAILFGVRERHRFGAGLTVHLSPTAMVKMDGAGRDSINFDPAAGLILEYDYLVMDHLWLGTRFTLINYKKETYFGSESFDGNHIGLMAHLRF
ncbi:hypothetical protein [uncultured Zhongshania sp.]|uniref:hypothetical protein n=1 Tax=uncultured Zhongshania sp. TaxID=1642288 RepID=UPI0030DD8073|tara:strand:+ start:2088 stop:2693 length:606 start_codon:yes stop_codon:yes gene_type:complete